MNRVFFFVVLYKRSIVLQYVSLSKSKTAIHRAAFLESPNTQQKIPAQCDSRDFCR